jgi:hypothetical protein
LRTAAARCSLLPNGLASVRSSSTTGQA